MTNHDLNLVEKATEQHRLDELNELNYTTEKYIYKKSHKYKENYNYKNIQLLY